MTDYEKMIQIHHRELWEEWREEGEELVLKELEKEEGEINGGQ